MRRKIGDQRIKEEFLFLPKTIYSERRWLEYAVWMEELDSAFKWMALYWISKIESLWRIE